MTIKLNKTLILNAIQKEYRNRTLIFLLALSIFLIYAINGFMDFFGGGLAPAAGKLAVLYGIISAWGGLLGLLLGSGCISSDRSSSVMPIILALPVSRGEYLLARALGTWLIVLGYYAISLMLGFLAFSISSTGLAIEPRVLLAFGINALTILAAITLGIFFSLFMNRTRAFLMSLLTSWAIMASNSVLANQGLAEQFSNLSLMKGLALGIHYLLPRLSNMGDMAQAVLTAQPLTLNPLVEGAHFVLTLGLLALAALVVFKRQDF